MKQPQWTAAQIELHQEGARQLEAIKDKAFAYIREHKNTNEYEVQQFILGEFRRHTLRLDKYPPIVAFRASAAEPHYWPKKASARTLEPNSLVLIDIWSKIKKPEAPYADITWVGYYGKVPDKVKTVFSLVMEARDAALDFIGQELRRGNMPSGRAVDEAACHVIEAGGFAHSILHRTGHSLGFTSPHGIWGRVAHKNPRPLVPNLGYTIEPGIYLPGEFGIRSEINFYITEGFKLVVTTPPQKDLVML